MPLQRAPRADAGGRGVTRARLTVPHLLMALAVMAVWGTNFVVVKHALGDLPPLTLGALRFTAVFLPAALFLKRPRVAWRNLAAYGMLIGAGQFGALFIALRHDVSPGLASLLMQQQVFLTIGLAMLIDRERVARAQIVALIFAVAGIAVILTHTDGSVTVLGYVLTVVAASGWAGGNMVAKSAGRIDMLPYVVWSSLFAVPPLFVMALVFEGPTAMAAGIVRADAGTWAAVAWQAVGNAMFGYSVWGWLLARYPAATVAPLALLIPVFGMASSALLLGEPLFWWKLTGAGLVIGGLAIGIVGGRTPRVAVATDPA